MKEKKLLFGNVTMSKGLYNFLYAILCLVVWFMMMFYIVGCSLYFKPDGQAYFDLIQWSGIPVLTFIGYKMIKKGNFVE